jgi:hypothetical protein
MPVDFERGGGQTDQRPAPVAGTWLIPRRALWNGAPGAGNMKFGPFCPALPKNGDAAKTHKPAPPALPNEATTDAVRQSPPAAAAGVAWCRALPGCRARRKGTGCVALALAPEVFASGLHVGGFLYRTGGGPGPPFEGMIERRNLRISEEPGRLLDRNAIIFEIAKSKAIT